MEWKKQIFNKENMDKIKGFKLRRSTIRNKNSAERIPGSAENSAERIAGNQSSLRASNESLSYASLDESMESA